MSRGGCVVSTVGTRGGGWAACECWCFADGEVWEDSFFKSPWDTLFHTRVCFVFLEGISVAVSQNSNKQSREGRQLHKASTGSSSRRRFTAIRSGGSVIGTAAVKRLHGSRKVLYCTEYALADAKMKLIKCPTQHVAEASRKTDDRQVHEARDSRWTLLYSYGLLSLTANQGCGNISGSMLALYPISKNRHGSPPVRSNSVLRNRRTAQVGSESGHDTVSPGSESGEARAWDR